MQLAGYRRASANRNGGIRSVALVRTDDVAAVEYDELGGRVTALTLREGKEFAIFGFKEDEASYAEKTASNPTGILVTHTLSFALERMSPEATAAIERLAAAPNGSIAVVTFNNDVSVVAGYSPRFAMEYPLRLQTAAGSSGRRITDTCAETITLSSVDTQKAKAFAGSIPQ